MNIWNCMWVCKSSIFNFVRC